MMEIQHLHIKEKCVSISEEKSEPGYCKKASKLSDIPAL